MTPDWREFFRILCGHRQGYKLGLSYEEAVDYSRQDALPLPLFMVPLPVGHPRGITALAKEWISGSVA